MRYKYFYNKYKFINNYWDVVISDIWKEILLNSYIKEEINSALENSKYYATKNINSWEITIKNMAGASGNNQNMSFTLNERLHYSSEQTRFLPDMAHQSTWG